MNLNDKKRQRSLNWDEVEKTLLFELVKEDVLTLENKKKTNVFNNDKMTAWERIRQKLQAEGYTRDIKRIKEQWQRMKVQAKKNVCSYKRSCSKTGGGSPGPEPSDMDWKIKDLLPYEFTEDQSSFDSDSINIRPIEGETDGETIEIYLPAASDNSENKENETTCNIVPLDIAPDARKENSRVEDSWEEILILQEGSEQRDEGDELDNALKTPNKKRKVKSKEMSEYERKLLELNQKRINQVMQHAEEMHQLRMQQEKEFHEERLRLLKKQKCL